MTDASKASSLKAIREKEIELDSRLTEAEKQGRRIIDEAHDEALRMRDEASAKAAEDAAAQYSKEVEAARVEAEAIRSSIDASIKGLEKSAASRRESVAEKIIGWVVPKKP